MKSEVRVFLLSTATESLVEPVDLSDWVIYILLIHFLLMYLPTKAFLEIRSL